MNTINNSANQFILNLKYLFHKPKLLLMMVFAIFILSLVPMIFIPMYMGMGLSFALVNVVAVNLSYASLSYNWKKSSISKNQKLTKVNRVIFNFNILMAIMIVSLCCYVFFLALVYLYDMFGLMLISWRTTGEAGGLRFDSVRWIQMTYFFLLNTVVYFAISFALARFFSNEKSYHIFSISLFLLTIVFGTGFNDYFDWYEMDGDKVYACFKVAMFPYNTYWISMLFPFFPSAQLMASLSEAIKQVPDGQEQMEWAVNFSAFIILGKGDYVTFTDSMPTALYWDITWFASYVWIVILGLIGILVPGKK